MARSISSILAVLAVALTLACNNQPAATSAANDQQTAVSQNNNLTAEQLGELGAQIKKSPDQADKLLADRGLTQESFEQAVRKVAEDPQQSKRYAAAYKKAGA